MNEEELLMRVTENVTKLRIALMSDEDFGGPLTLELDGQELSVIGYALGVAFLGEMDLPGGGNDRIVELIAKASEAILVGASAEHLDAAINDILGGGDG